MRVNEECEMVAVKDWRKALRTPPGYRIINKTLRSQTQFISVVAIAGLLVLIILYIFPKKSSSSSGILSINYNYTYPLTTPIKTNSMHTFRIGENNKKNVN